MDSKHEHQPESSISVVTYENEPIERRFLDEIRAAYDELRQLLPKLPNQLKVIFGTNYDYGDDGVTGSAVSADTMKIGIDDSVEDRTKQHAKNTLACFS